MKLNIRDMIITAMFSALMIAGAFLKIPFPFVPLTFQPFFCALSGILLGPRLGPLSQLIYLGLGLAGLPVFAYGGGITYIFNPTFGYLLGFTAASFIIGKLSEKIKDLNFFSILKTLIPGLIVINIIGVPYLYLIKNLYLNENISFNYILGIVFLPFFLKDLFLYVIASVIASRVLPIIRQGRKSL